MAESHHLPTYLLLKTLATLLRAIYHLFLSSSLPTPISTLSIPSRNPSRTIKFHIYKPPTSTTKPGPHPVLLNFHGSGFVITMHGSDAVFCARIAAETGITVLDCDYRKAPEDPFPAALEDVEDAVRYVLSRPAEYDSQRTHLSGFSAGANLAMAVCGLPLGGKGMTGVIGTKIKAVLAFYPPTDLVTKPALKRAPDGSAGTLPAPLASFFNTCYMLPGTPASDPRISVKNMKPESFPRSALVVTCGKDDLAFEAEELAGRMAERGEGRVEWRRVEGVEHAWDKSVKPGSGEEGKRDEAYEWAVEFLREGL
jgi:acetyl esterase/lipase